MLGISMVAAAMLGGAAGAATPSVDPPNTHTESFTVKFADLNLDRPRDVARLYSRIHIAAKIVCGVPSGDDIFLPVRADEDRCLRETETRAIAATHVPALAALYTKKFGGAALTLADETTRMRSSLK
jgi:UrcA family protein